MKPYLILMGIEMIIAFLIILQFTWFSFLNAITGAIIKGYFFVCVHSLWEVFRDEAMRGHNRHYQQGSMLEKF